MMLDGGTLLVDRGVGARISGRRFSAGLKEERKPEMVQQKVETQTYSQF
jgi:hypothetical protein